jgi:hypothetical protein
MASVPKDKERSQQASPDKSGNPTFSWQTTHTSIRDAVKLIMPPSQVLPIVFVPGIMGSNLCSNKGKPVWLLNSTAGLPMGLAWEWARKGPGARQTILHPERTKVYADGDVPKEGAGSIQDRAEFAARGWGEVSKASYHAFLLWLEKKLNSEGFDPARWTDFFYNSLNSMPAPGVSSVEPKFFPGTMMQMNGLPSHAEGRHTPDPIMSDELLQRAKFRFPVYACGYNWLASNDDAADRLKSKIYKIIEENNKGAFKCTQVILVTHSMGGLVARACAQLQAMEAKIAGIVHGVMPTVGAAVAYRRCKIGMMDEDVVSAFVIGADGPAVTAVFAQAPGALQLLPSQEYGLGWLHINDENGRAIERLPVNDPYTEIYLRKDRWWGLVSEDWLAPQGGTPIVWNNFVKNIKLAKDFHTRISGKYHPKTFVYYGAGDGKQASFETITWAMRFGVRPQNGTAPTGAQTVNFSYREVRADGANKIYVGGERKIGTHSGTAGFGDSSAHDPILETSFWELTCQKQDGRGDGTVPASSGMFPRSSGGQNILQQFRLVGFSHEPAYKDPTAQRVTHYAITKIAAGAKLS